METTRSMQLEQTKHGWALTTPGTLTDTEAQAITFRADPDQVRLGTYVEVVDAEGIRIGRITSATYHTRMTGPAYVVCHIDLN